MNNQLHCIYTARDHDTTTHVSTTQNTQ